MHSTQNLCLNFAFVAVLLLFASTSIFAHPTNPESPVTGDIAPQLLPSPAQHRPVHYEAEFVKYCQRYFILDLKCNMSVALFGMRMTPDEMLFLEDWLIFHRAMKMSNGFTVETQEKSDSIIMCFVNVLYVGDKYLGGCVSHAIWLQEDTRMDRLDKQIDKEVATKPCNPIEEDEINLHYEVKPSKEQIAYCWRNPTKCTMRLATYGMGFKEWQVAQFKWWNEHHFENTIEEDCECDATGCYLVPDKTQLSHVDPTKEDRDLHWALVMYGCFKEEKPFLVHSCLNKLLDQSGHSRVYAEEDWQ